MPNYVFLGPPGAGKGTMAGLLRERFGFAHVSTGDMLRAEIKAGTDLGRTAQGYMEQGALLPDEVMGAIVDRRLGRDDIRLSGVILDGYPRTVPQAGLLRGILTRHELTLDAVVFFEVEREILIQRLTGRRLCPACGALFNLTFAPPAVPDTCDHCGHSPLAARNDDRLETVLERLTVYETETAPLIRHYEERDCLIRVPASGARDETLGLLTERLGL
jgi:adenylate kinase